MMPATTAATTDLLHALHHITVPDWLRQQAKAYPAQLALSAPSHRGCRDRLSYAQLVARMHAMAHALYARGLRRSDRVMLFLPNTAAREGVLTALGCWQLGAVVCPLNCRASDDELRHALELVEPALMVASTAAEAQRLESLGMPAGRTLLLDAASTTPKNVWPDPEDVPAPSQALPPDAPASPHDLSCLLFTSGTTARAKAVMHTHYSQLHTGFSMGGAVGLRGGDTYQIPAPLYTSSVLNLACMSAWVYGAGVVLEEDTLTNASRLRLIASEATSVYHGVPAVLHFMIDEFSRSHDDGGYNLLCVRRFAYGGATMPVEVIKRYAQLLPHADQVQVWALTETGPAGTFLPPWMLPRKAGALGFAQPACALRILADTTTTTTTTTTNNNNTGTDELIDVPPGEVGEIAFAGPSAAVGYFRNPEASAQTFVNGWVLTGDLGRIDHEGVLYFVDRKKDIINRGGLKISSATIEDVLYRHASVAQAAVIAIPHDKLGEDIAACVVVREGASFDAQDLQDFCAQHLTSNHVPRHWFALPALPRNGMGKILKRELRAQVLEK